MNTTVSSSQLTLDFTPGLSERHTSLKSCVRERCYANSKPLKTVAANMDLSESELSRKLGDNPEDKRNLSVDDFEAYLASTKDVTPIYYLVEKYLTDTDVKKRRAMDQLEQLLPDLVALVKQARSA